MDSQGRHHKEGEGHFEARSQSPETLETLKKLLEHIHHTYSYLYIFNCFILILIKNFYCMERHIYCRDLEW